jgi:hypothetical protein
MNYLLVGGATIEVSGEDFGETQYFCCIKVSDAGVLSVEYQKSPSKTIKAGKYGAYISKSKAKSLLNAILSGRKSFSCQDEDGEKLIIKIN